jgi:transcriptional regulator of aroF, aroG, tyrA and aromatic amino acid transport
MEVLVSEKNIRRIRIRTIDRVHMTADILRVFSAYQVNIIWMEVYTHVVYIKFESGNDTPWSSISKEILAISGVQGLEDVGLIAFEEREQLIETILKSSSDGFIVINKEKVIELANPTAMRILHDDRFFEGMPLANVLPPLDLVDQAIGGGVNFGNHPLFFDNRGKICHCLVSSSTITNETGTVQGVILTLRDMQDVREMVHSITQSRQISFSDIITRNADMLAVVKLARNVARNKSTVLIRGESGTGKELFARAIHSQGLHRNNPFVPLNCAAIPDTLIESELFGYEDGTFTGGKKGGKQGLFELAHGGTLFLDEVGELSPHVQAKLLRVLQEGSIRRVGGQKEIPVNVRVITATHRDLESLVKSGQFREDLFYRLHVIPLQIPPLREHKDDIPILARHFMNMLGPQLDKAELSLDPAALEKLMGYDWPGNIRELSNVIERAICLCEGNVITGELVFVGTGASGVQQEEQPVRGLAAAVAATERALIEKAIIENRSIRQAAKALGVTHTLLLNRMKKLKISSMD